MIRFHALHDYILSPVLHSVDSTLGWRTEALCARAPLDAELFARTSAAEARAEATERMLAAANAKAASAEARAAEAQRFIDSFINS